MADGHVLRWDKPGAGSWTWDQSHFAGAPTPLLRRCAFPNLEAGLETVFARFGVPMLTFLHRTVNGRVYRRLAPVIGAETDRRRPLPIIWLAMRLHPELRRRERQARRAFAERIWRQDLRRWNDTERQRIVQRNLALQDEDPEGLDDAALTGHLGRACALLGDGYRLHFELRAADAGAVGDLLVESARWGLAAAAVIDALAGASPASATPLVLRRLGDLVGDRLPGSLDELRGLGDDVAEALDAYLRDYGWRMVTSYDIDGRTLGELPGAILTSIGAARGRSADVDRGHEGHEARVDRLRARVPAHERAEFDRLLGEARSVYGLRDDNGPLTVEWPTGLLRRAVLVAGGRLVERGALLDAEHACELDLDELQRLLTAGEGPTASEVAVRAACRSRLAGVSPPPVLGAPEPELPDWVFPPAMGRAVRILRSAVTHLEAAEHEGELCGTGVGVAAYRGRARVARDPQDALSAIEPGDVLVAAFTNPAYNSVLCVAGAVVCEQGGALSHAAITARELGIPAVVGVAGALRVIADGDEVEVDPVAGAVRVSRPRASRRTDADGPERDPGPTP